MVRHLCLSTILLLVLAPTVHAEEGPGREFTATAEVETPSGTRSMNLTILIRRATPKEEAKPLAEVLAEGGQRALQSALQGRGDGTLRLGALESPLDLVTFEPKGDGYRIVVVSARPIRVEEANQGRDSLDYPFTVVAFEVGTFGSGEGELYLRAALSVGEDGRPAVKTWDGSVGRLLDVERTR